MARDYKRRSRKKPPTPGWVWFASGLALGLAVALVVHLQHAGTAPPAEPVATRSAEPASQQADETLDETVDATVEEEDGFDFYTMLPGLEVVVPEEPVRERRDDREAAAAPDLAPGRYWIQAGSFRRFADADRRKAELALLGLESSIQAVAIEGQTWHRVRIGPLPNATEAEAARRQLADAGIGALAVRERN
ncbi:MAG: SPOR domain-containing protein [Gammaproteobacteria bacterium]|jgi:cell division protein FtsN